MMIMKCSPPPTSSFLLLQCFLLLPHLLLPRLAAASQPPLLAERRQKPGFWVDIFDNAEHEQHQHQQTTPFSTEDARMMANDTRGSSSSWPTHFGTPIVPMNDDKEQNKQEATTEEEAEKEKEEPTIHAPTLSTPPPFTEFPEEEQTTTTGFVPPAIGNEEEERLSIDIFKGYNALIRPAPCHNHSVVYVDFGMAMILLINVDEKNQIMQSNAWLTLKWNDCRFSWNPADYGGLESMRVPVDRVWVPDIVLFNNADGNYEVSFQSNVVVDYQGNVSWVPPAIYKSSCRIDVEYFPFDEQTCVLHFGSWTYGPEEVQLHWYGNKRSVELEDYSPSGIWDIMEVPGRMAPDRSRVEFHIVIRRKTLFYTVILIIPTVLMAFLSMLVFYLPAECSEKITLAISILLALVVFLLLVSKILPPTSDTIPLMAKYLLMTFVMNILTIMSTVCVLNVHFRSALTHEMPGWVQQLFLHILPQLLCMHRPRRPSIFGVDDDNNDNDDDGGQIVGNGKSEGRIRKKKKHFGRSTSSRRSSTSSSAVIGGGGRQCRPSLNAAFPGMAMAGMLPFASGSGGETTNNNNNNSSSQNCTGGDGLNRNKLQQKRATSGKGGSERKQRQQQKQQNAPPSPGSPLPQLRRSQTSFISAECGGKENAAEEEEEAAEWPLSGICQFDVVQQHENKQMQQFEEIRQPMRQQQMASTTNTTGGGSSGANRVCAKLGQLVEEQRMGQRLRQAVDSIAFIAEHIRADMSDKKVRDDWRFISTVIDRLLLLIFFGITMGGLCAIIASVPHVFELVDQQQVIRRLIAQSKLEAAMAMDAAAAATIGA